MLRAGGEGSLANVLDVRERLSQAHAGTSGQELPALDYLIGCSYQQGMSLQVKVRHDWPEGHWQGHMLGRNKGRSFGS